MRNVLRTIDSILNRFTMYKVVAWGLMLIFITAEVLSLTGLLSISALGLLASLVVLGVTVFVANTVFGKLLHAPLNSESYLITAVILSLILPVPTSWPRVGLLVLTGVVAMASKFVLVYRGSHIFNPAALAAFVMSVTGLLPAIWWVATPVLAPVVILVVLAVLRKTRKFSLFFGFAAISIALLLVTGLLRDQSFGTVLQNALFSWPVFFLGGIMLTEPTTMPPNRRLQIVYGVLVGSIFASQLHIGSLATTPQVALLIGNIFAAAVAPPLGLMLRLKRRTQLAPAYYDMAFEPVGGRKVAFLPGQFMEWTLTHPRADVRGNRRTFSISSSPAEPEVHIGFRYYKRSSSFKKALLAMEPGSLIRGAHVAGSFTLPSPIEGKMVFIAGGIGVTPFRSMIQDMLDKGVRHDVTLLYVATQEQDFVYKETFAKAESIGLKTHYLVEHLNAARIKALVPEISAARVYVSGPDAMVSSCQPMLREVGVGPMHIHTDHFSGY